MKTIYLKSILMAILFSISGLVAHAQDDTEGCNDHPLFNRMPNHYIYACEELEFSSMDFPVGNPDPDNENKINYKTIEGKIMEFRYALNEDAKKPSGLQVMRNFQNASKQYGGVILGEYKGWCSGMYEYGDINDGVMPIGNGCTNWSTTFMFVKDNLETWAYVQYSDDGYDIVIAEKETMRQDIHVNEMYDKINAGESLTLYINFETSKSTVKSDSKDILGNLYTLLSSNPDLKIIIEGHTDNIGNKSANQTLSDQRAASVKSELLKQGIAADRIKTIGHGQDKPIADNSTEEGKAKNRRVEIRKQ